MVLPRTNITNPLVDVTTTTNTTTSTNIGANLSGAVTVNVANGAAAYLAQRKMTIVSSTGLSGTFSGVTTSQNLSFLTPYLSYDANNVYLCYGLTPFSTVAKNINQRNVGNALTIAALGPVNSLGAPILNALFYGNYQNAQAVMDTVGGSGLAGVQSTAMQVGEMASSSVSDQIAFWRSGETMDATGRISQEGNNPRSFLAYAPVQRNVPAKGPINIKGPAGNLSAAVAPRTFRAWGSMFGGGANYLSDAGRGVAASNIGYYGGLIGVDYQIQPNILVGVTLGGSSSSFNVGSLSTNGNLTGFHAGVYGAYTMGNSYAALNETFSAYNNQTSRKAGGYSYLPYEQLSAQFGSTEFRTRGELGHGVLMGGLKATPFVAAEIAAYQSNAFSEQSSIYASTFALRNNGQGINSLPTFAGLRLSNAVTLSNGWRLAPVGSVAYVHEFFPQRQFNNMLISMPGSDFNVAGPRSTYNLVQTKVGAQLNLNEKLALFTDFQGEFSPVSQSYGGKG
ncbi:MAG: autotransporter outer membrane beta-barrel domain-containing protein, partial [Methylocystaceae bacterium]|nr:autotransporter outer membrane beta-barrel domain-containing protein [Methylocystaceae bacterium]